MTVSGITAPPIRTADADTRGAVRRAGAGRTPPIAWIEFTDDNGRGAAALTSFLLGSQKSGARGLSSASAAAPSRAAADGDNSSF